jgi:hypothetical protein
MIINNPTFWTHAMKLIGMGSMIRGIFISAVGLVFSGWSAKGLKEKNRKR